MKRTYLGLKIKLYEFLIEFFIRVLRADGCKIGRHPADAVYYNPYNHVTQCHRCGAATDWHGLTPKQADNLARGKSINA